MAFTTDWFSPNISTWLRILKKYKGKENLSFLEIGCFEGRATKWLLENILTGRNSKITVIDTFDGGPDLRDLKLHPSKLLKVFKENISDYLSDDKDKNRVIIKKGDSVIVLRKIAPQENFDFIYIDGSHTARDVLIDGLLSWGLLKVGGIMIFDDYEWNLQDNPIRAPKLALNVFLSIWQGEYKILDKGYQIAVQKINLGSKLDRGESAFYSVDIDNLKQQIKQLTEDLNKIQTSKTYRIWQYYCEIKKRVLGSKKL